jgi:hypothetical protein
MQPATQVSLNPKFDDIRHLRADQSFYGAMAVSANLPETLGLTRLPGCECS